MDFLDFVNRLSLTGNQRQKRVIFYSIDKLLYNPFVYFTGIQRGGTVDAFPTFETKEDITVKGMVFKGIHPFKDTDYHVYEIPVVEQVDKPSPQCKITLYELLYVRHVHGVPIDPSSILFLKAHSYLCILRIQENEDKEIKPPATFYVALPKCCLKEQLFSPSTREGRFKKGYYLYTHERCLELPRDRLLTVPNTLSLDAKKVTQRKGHLFVENHDLGPVPEKGLTYTMEHCSPQWITLQTNKPHSIKEEWCMVRYLCNMDNHLIGPHVKPEYDSFSYDQTYKYVNPDRVQCVSIQELV